MAAIGTIRKYSGLLIGAIGVSLVAFLVMDFTNSQFGILQGRKDTVGKINGQTITYNDFTKKYEENVQNAEEQMRGQSMSDDQRNYLRTQTWNDIVNDLIFDKVYTDLGIGVTSDEMRELAMGENASPYIRNDQQFRNPQTGQFDPAQVSLYLQRLDQDPQGVEPGTVRRQWLKFESLLKKNQFQQKYDNLISKGLYVPSWLGEVTYNERTRTADFQYVQFAYSDISDDDVKVTDDDIKKYIEENKSKFIQEEETRKLQYVAFDIAASPSDVAALTQSLEEKRADFAEGKTASEDSLFVKINSITPFDEAYYTQDQLNSVVKDSFFLLPVKSVIGPYTDYTGATIQLAKISDRKLISDSVRVRDIKIGFEGVTSQEAANEKFKLIDSIFLFIDTLKADFGAIASVYSEDPFSKMQGGNIGWVKQGEKEKAYNDLIFFRAQKGKLYKVPVQAENAIHIIQVVEDRPSKPAVQISYLTKEILPSSETERSIYSSATAFAADNQTEAKFVEAGKKANAKTVNALQKDAFSVDGLGSARDIVKWAFNAKKGDVSSVFTIGNKHVVALLQEVYSKGLPSVEALREAVKPAVVQQKKYELLSEKINMAKAASIDDLAAKFDKQVLSAEQVTFSTPNVGGAYEFNVAAAALTTPVNKVSKPVKGTSGVYVVQPTNIAEPGKVTDNSSAFAPYKLQLSQQLQGKSRYAQQVQKKLAKVDDNRFDFF